MSLKMQIKASRVVKSEELGGVGEVCVCVWGRGGQANSGDAANQILLQCLLGASVAAPLSLTVCGNKGRAQTQDLMELFSCALILSSGTHFH